MTSSGRYMRFKVLFFFVKGSFSTADSKASYEV